jgi:hypothetical protein
MSRPLRSAALALVVSACFTVAPRAHAAIDIPANTWVKRPVPTKVGLTGFSGSFQARGWNHMLYDAVGKRMVLYDGYLDASRPYSIYANALWTYDPAANRLALENVSNWVRSGGTTVPLPLNTTEPTPYDRHSYACIVMVPDKNRLYMWSGANNSISTNYIGDTWTYDFGTKKWREIVTATHPFTSFEQTMTYDPNTRRLVLFAGAPAAYDDGNAAWLFNVDTETWELATTPTTPSARMSQTMVYDPVRRVSWMFGGGPYPNPGSELWTFDASSRIWQRITPINAGPAPRRFTSMAYDSRHDVILLWGGIGSGTTVYADTWVFQPGTRTWTQLTPPSSPPPVSLNAEDLAYDAENDAFVLHLNGEFWLYRYASTTNTDAFSPFPIRDLRVR